MAVSRKSGADWDELVKRAAAEIKRINPHIGIPALPLSDEDYTQVLDDARELERIWNEIDRCRDERMPPYSAADAVDEDRGQ
ncbi:MAG TPA: hypothetical protein VKT52_00710 [Ktedonobacterales bacterium]|nr:hypothetical protein [Ktedonobacterales bacterium]